ncbi:hypothetical protein KAT92_04085 [Candidatus Babeliales bacterium]|nr:hypothetical protein [Candidatus Babeliales bacterium]
MNKQVFYRALRAPFRASGYLASIATVFISIGLLSFFLYQDILVVRWMRQTSLDARMLAYSKKHVATTKPLMFYFWRDEVLIKEVRDFLWHDDPSGNLRLVTGSWLSFLYDERAITKLVSVEAVALSDLEHEVYISLDQSPFDRDWSIFKKWHMIDALGKTLRGVSDKVQSFVLLVDGRPMVDEHLDFSQGWSIDGFGDDA